MAEEPTVTNNDNNLNKKDLSDEELEREINKLTFGDNSSSESTGKSEPSLNLKKFELKPSQFSKNIERYHFLCKDFPSPNTFINFDFYFMIAACLARRVWIDSNDLFGLYPNLYIIFVSHPGLGKSLPARVASKLLGSLLTSKLDRDTGRLVEKKLLNLGPDAITFEKLVLRAAASTEAVKLDNGKIYQHSSTTFCLGDELGTLFNDNTRRVVSFLTQAFDCDKWEGDTIKHGEKIIKNICINFLGCTNPDLMTDLMRSKVLSNGFVGRFIPIWGETKRPHPARMIETEEQKHEAEHIRRHLRKLCLIKPFGVKFTKEAEAWIDDWHKNKADIHLNKHPKLLDYYARKKENMRKIAVCNAFADNLEPIVDVSNLIAAENLLLSVEPMMHKALALTGENPHHKLGEDIKTYLLKNGATTKRAIILQFYADCKNGIDGLAEVFDYLVNTDQCEYCTKDGKDGLKMKGYKI